MTKEEKKELDTLLSFYENWEEMKENEKKEVIDLMERFNQHFGKSEE